MKNQETDIKKRKYGNAMIVCGYAIIALAVWGLIKSLIYYTFSMDIIDLFGDYADSRLMVSLALLIIGVLVLIDFVFRLYICKCAVSEGMGIQKRGHLYLVIAGLMAISSIVSVIYTFKSQTGVYSDVEKIFSMIIDATSATCNIELVCVAIRFKKICALEDLKTGEVNG